MAKGRENQEEKATHCSREILAPAPTTRLGMARPDLAIYVLIV